MKTDPNPTPAKQSKRRAARPLVPSPLVRHRDQVQHAILGESSAVQDVLLPVLHRVAYSPEELAEHGPLPLVTARAGSAMVVLHRLRQGSTGELQTAYASLMQALAQHMRDQT